MLLIYDASQLISTVCPGMSINVNGVTLKIVEVVRQSACKFVLIQVSHRLHWLYLTGRRWRSCVLPQTGAAKGCIIRVGGRTNRAQVAFEREILERF